MSSPPVADLFASRQKLVLMEKAVAYRTVRRHRVELPVQVLDSLDVVKAFLAPIFEATPVEALYALAINSASEFLGFVRLSTGTVSRAAVYPRELMTFVLSETNATAVILAHNHPGGRAEASREDLELTRRVRDMLQPLEVRLLDHVIYVPSHLGQPGEWLSMRQENLL